MKSDNIAGKKSNRYPQKKGHHFVLLESATPGPIGQTLGVTVWGQQLVGWRFSLSAASKVVNVGVHISSESLGMPLFAAIIKLSSFTSLPAFAPRLITTSPDTLTHLLFVPPKPSNHLVLPLSAPLVLQAGTYGLVFGGADTAVSQNPYTPFSATGTGVMPVNNVDLPGSTYFFGDQFAWNALVSPNNLRFAVQYETIMTGDMIPPAPPTGLHVS